MWIQIWNPEVWNWQDKKESAQEALQRLKEKDQKLDNDAKHFIDTLQNNFSSVKSQIDKLSNWDSNWKKEIFEWYEKEVIQMCMDNFLDENEKSKMNQINRQLESLMSWENWKIDNIKDIDTIKELVDAREQLNWIPWWEMLKQIMGILDNFPQWDVSPQDLEKINSTIKSIFEDWELSGKDVWSIRQLNDLLVTYSKVTTLWWETTQRESWTRWVEQPQESEKKEDWQGKLEQVKWIKELFKQPFKYTKDWEEKLNANEIWQANLLYNQLRSEFWRLINWAEKDPTQMNKLSQEQLNSLATAIADWEIWKKDLIVLKDIKDTLDWKKTSQTTTEQSWNAPSEQVDIQKKAEQIKQKIESVKSLIPEWMRSPAIEKFFNWLTQEVNDAGENPDKWQWTTWEAILNICNNLEKMWKDLDSLLKWEISISKIKWLIEWLWKLFWNLLQLVWTALPKLLKLVVWVVKDIKDYLIWSTDPQKKWVILQALWSLRDEVKSWRLAWAWDWISWQLWQEWISQVCDKTYESWRLWMSVVNWCTDTLLSKIWDTADALSITQTWAKFWQVWAAIWDKIFWWWDWNKQQEWIWQQTQESQKTWWIDFSKIWEMIENLPSTVKDVIASIDFPKILNNLFEWAKEKLQNVDFLNNAAYNLWKIWVTIWLMFFSWWSSVLSQGLWKFKDFSDQMTKFFWVPFTKIQEAIKPLTDKLWTYFWKFMKTVDEWEKMISMSVDELVKRSSSLIEKMKTSIPKIAEFIAQKHENLNVVLDKILNHPIAKNFDLTNQIRWIKNSIANWEMWKASTKLVDFAEKNLSDPNLNQVDWIKELKLMLANQLVQDQKQWIW